MTPTKARTLRAGADGIIYSRDYVPLISENGDYVFGSRCFSIFDLRSGSKTESNSHEVRANLFRKRRGWLQTNYGLSRSSAELLLSRRKAEVKRIEDFVHGLIDTILLFDCTLLRRGNDDGRRTIRYLVRMTLTVGTYGVGTVMKYWKEFCSFLYNRAAQFETELPLPGPRNYFYRGLVNLPMIQRIISGNMDKRLCEAFAHLTSTRHLACGDHRAEVAAKRKFLETIETPYPVDVVFLNKISATAERIGEKCLNFPGVRSGRPHISLNCAGSYYETVKDGGRGKEIRESISPILKHRPSVDEEIETPFGPLRCPAGEPRWRYWTRRTPYTWYPDTDFGEVIKDEYFGRINGQEYNLFYQGFDEFIGKQILVCAYLEYRNWSMTKLGIPCRVLTVPEPGYKARIVTTGPFWLTVLQQSLAHTCKTYLSAHPSARSSLQKTDQAWQALYLMSGKEYPEDFLCLSSDLSEATDYIPKEIGLALLSGFIKGAGIRSSMIEMCLDLLRSDRTFISTEGISERQTRGIMMGEPLTKSVLTILNLVVEELAMRDYLGVSVYRSFYDSPKWRTYHVGGDDHLAIGPKPYLDNITLNHLRCGSKISEGKHGTSKLLVKYCEKVLEIRRIYSPFDVRRINDSTEHYEACPFVDSVKVRLLSPLTKAFEVSADKNVAIGKGLSLGRTLKWLNRDHFSIKWTRMVRDRFFQRMGSLLPDRTSGMYWQLLMPPWWGGLDLYFPDEVEDLHQKLPELTLSIMGGLAKGDSRAIDEAKLLRKLLSNYSYRGYRLLESDVSVMLTHLEEVVKNPNFTESTTWWELKQTFDPKGEKSAKDVASLIDEDGWKAEEDILDELMRPVLFREILLGREKAKPYNTVHLKKRYASLWDQCFVGPCPLSAEEFKKTLLGRPKGRFYKVGRPEVFHFESDRGYIYKSILDDALHGMPVLSTEYPYA